MINYIAVKIKKKTENIYIHNRFDIRLGNKNYRRRTNKRKELQLENSLQRFYDKFLRLPATYSQENQE